MCVELESIGRGREKLSSVCVCVWVCVGSVPVCAYVCVYVCLYVPCLCVWPSGFMVRVVTGQVIRYLPLQDMCFVSSVLFSSESCV